MAAKLENGKTAFTPRHHRSTDVFNLWDLVSSLIACANKPTETLNAVGWKKIDLRFFAEKHFCSFRQHPFLVLSSKLQSRSSALFGDEWLLRRVSSEQSFVFEDVHCRPFTDIHSQMRVRMLHHIDRLLFWIRLWQSNQRSHV